MNRVLILVSLALACCLCSAQTTSMAQEASTLRAIRSAYAHAKSVYTKHPSSAAKKNYVISTVRYGTASMLSPALDRKVKYRQALRLYREALKLDPKNEEARNNSEMIVSIYRQMGRPVPK